LWPEKEKLYGHGFEIMAVGTSKDGKYVASACKASKAEYASIILWSATNYKKIIELPGHALTVTTIVFSPDGKWLVSAGRDRSWILHQKTNDEQGSFFDCKLLDPYRFYSRNAKSHSRIIWKCSWSADSQFFATASRDKYLKIWSPNDALAPIFEHLFDDSVTSCDFAPYEIQSGEYMLAVGLESGNISILYISRLADNTLNLKLKKDLPFE
jgi:elongator complex protein 2